MLMTFIFQFGSIHFYILLSFSVMDLLYGRCELLCVVLTLKTIELSYVYKVRYIC